MTTKDEVRDWREEIIKEWEEMYYEKGERSESDIRGFWLSKFDTLLTKKREEIERLRGKNKEWGEAVELAYNEAIDEVIKILN